MTWSADGWSFDKDGLDFTGGTPVHVSGTATLVLGTIFLWFKLPVKSPTTEFDPE